jgi:hypothetical protein
MSDKKRNKRWWRNHGITLRGLDVMALLEQIIDNGCNYHPRPTSKRGWKRMAAQNQKWRKFERRRAKLRKMERECADVRH